MDLASLPISHLEALAVRLERCADEADELAARTRHGTSPSWRGAAADRHAEVVAGHEHDLFALGADLREAATRVRALASTARERAVLLGDAVELTWEITRSTWVLR